MATAKKARYKKLKLVGGKRDITVYASPNILAALNKATLNMDLYDGVKFGQAIEAVYEQGLKDGRSEVFKEVTSSVKTIEGKLPHKNPGRPRKSKK